jgi:multidrug efflux pump subunit AcrB
MKNVLAAFARNTVFANILLVLIFLAGGLSIQNMIRENFPEFSLDMITITVPYPGADPEEVEEGISRKIEEALVGTEGIKLITTQSNENVGSALIEVREDYEVMAVLDKVRTRVNAISTFPRDAEKPIITELLLKDPVLLLYLSADMSERRLKEWAERFKDEIQQLPQVSQVALFGTREYEIGIEISEQRLRQYGLSLDQVAAAVRRSNLNLSGGTIRTSGEEIRLRTMGRRYTGAELADIVVLATPQGDLITLDKVAAIRDDFTEDPISAMINGEPSVMLIVYKTKQEDALTISRAVTQHLEERRNQLPQGIQLNVLYDNTEMLRARIDLLVRNGIIGMTIVLLVLYIFLDARLSFWAGLGIPISIAGAMVIVGAMGATLNMISLFGLILVLGIVVDDAIVVGEAIYVQRKKGLPPLKAAVEGVSEVGMPVIAAVLTTIVAFVPLLFVGGIMGKFIAILPVVVIACLVFSLVECMLMLPAHLSKLPDPNGERARLNPVARRLDAFHHVTSSGLEWFIGRVYTPFLKKTLYWRYISLCAAISLMLIVGGIIAGGILKFEVFPDIDGFIMTATVEYPTGSPAAVTEQAIAQIDAALLRLEKRTRTVSGEPLLKDRIALVGQTLEDPHVFKKGPHVGSVQAILIDSAQRGIHANDLMVQWEAEIGALPGIKSLTFAGLQAGPPGDPIEVWLQGHDMQAIIAASEELMAKLRTFDGVYQIRSDFSPGKNEIRFSLKPQAHMLGLTVEDLARQVYAGYYGSEALRLQRGRDDVRVKVRYTSDERRTLSDLEQVRIRTPAGYEVPLRSVADWTFAPGYATITRTDGMRRVAVSAGVDSNRANATEIFAELKTGFFPQLSRNYPGIHVDLQGEQKKVRESLEPLKVGFLLAMVGILVVIATLFRSYAQPFIILFTVPFGIIGAVLGHLLLGYDMSMMSLFGIVALAGVVVNGAIVMIERVNENLALRMSFFEAILAAGARRFRAIFLTTISTVGGLSPLILETDLQAKFLIPMALSLAAGVAFATVLTLALIPALLVILNDLRRLVFRVLRKRWPTREEVEPATARYTDDGNDASGELPPGVLEKIGFETNPILKN